MTWIDSAIETAGSDIEVDVSHLDLGTETIMVKPLTAAEYQTLKSHPELRTIKDVDDRNEQLGLLMIAEMMSKCDSTISWNKLKQLPLMTLGHLSKAITDKMGSLSGGGVLGE